MECDRMKAQFSQSSNANPLSQLFPESKPVGRHVSRRAKCLLMQGAGLRDVVVVHGFVFSVERFRTSRLSMTSKFALTK